MIIHGYRPGENKDKDDFIYLNPIFGELNVSKLSTLDLEKSLLNYLIDNDDLIGHSKTEFITQNHGCIPFRSMDDIEYLIQMNELSVDDLHLEKIYKNPHDLFYTLFIFIERNPNDITYDKLNLINSIIIDNPKEKSLSIHLMTLWEFLHEH